MTTGLPGQPMRAAPPVPTSAPEQASPATRPPAPAPAPATAPAPGTARRRRWASQLGAWGLMTPVLVVLLLMTVAPAVYIFRASFRNETLLGTGGRWVGLENYQFVLTDPTARRSMVITVLFVLVAVALEMVLGLLLALPLAGNTRANNIATTLLLLPFAVTPVVSALVVRELLNPNYGWVNYYLSRLGLPSGIEWLSNPSTAWIAVIGLDVWQWTPFVALIMIAGLQSLPAEPLEAA